MGTGGCGFGVTRDKSCGQLDWQIFNLVFGIPVKFIEPKMTTDVPARMESRNHFVKFLIEK